MSRGGGYPDRRTLPLDPLLVHILYYICNIFWQNVFLGSFYRSVFWIRLECMLQRNLLGEKKTTRTIQPLWLLSSMVTKTQKNAGKKGFFCNLNRFTTQCPYYPRSSCERSHQQECTQDLRELQCPSWHVPKSEVHAWMLSSSSCSYSQYERVKAK